MRISYKTHPALKFFLQGDRTCLRISKEDFTTAKLLIDGITPDIAAYDGKINVVSSSFLKASGKASESLSKLIIDIFQSEDQELSIKDIYIVGANIVYLKLDKQIGKHNAIMSSITVDKYGAVLSCFAFDLSKNLLVQYYIKDAIFSFGAIDSVYQFSNAAIIFHLFKHYSNIEIKEVCANKKEKVKGDDKPLFNELPVSILHLNSTWFTEIIRNEGFDVRGHMRLQPYKREDGEWDRKLIWIDQFRKHGYHRRAQKVIEAEEAAQ
jgi:hypothetical protein